jgi:glyoxylase-like metal-dependent hydrolase (beta-lactamase superfamily II)
LAHYLITTKAKSDRLPDLSGNLHNNICAPMKPRAERDEHATRLSRRAFLALSGLAGAAAWLDPISSPLFAQRPFGSPATPLAGLVPRARKKAETAKMTVEKLRGKINVLINEVGGNIAVLHGKSGKLLVDTGLAGSQLKIADALASIGGEPVRHVVNTHWHFDHTDGNEWFHDAGAMIIAHENARKRMSEATRVDLWDFTFPPSPAAALPTFTLRAPGAQDGRAEALFHLNGTTVRLDTFEPAHTDGDTTVEFTDGDVIHLGDLWWNARYPFIDYGTGGSISGMIRAAEANLSRVSDKSIIIPGHGPVGNKSQLGEFRDMLVTVRNRVAALKKQSKSLEEVVAAKPTDAFDSKWGKSLLDGALFTRLVYAGV